MHKKALLVTRVSGFVPQFEMNNVKILQEMGYEVHYASKYNTLFMDRTIHGWQIRVSGDIPFISAVPPFLWRCCAHIGSWFS